MSDRPLEAGQAGSLAKRETGAEVAPGFWGETWAVFVKDVRSELRTRAALATILLFSVVSLTMVSMIVRTEDPALRVSGIDTPLRSFLLAGLLWIILFFSAMAGLPRTFVKEEEMRTAAALRLAARPSAVLAGKLLFNTVLVLMVAGVLLLLFLVLFTPTVKNWPLLLLYVFMGVVDIAGTATILGAIVARAGGKTYLMLPLAFPILLPILIVVIKGTATALQGNPGNLGVFLVSYLVAMVTLSAMLFDKVWTDS